MKIGARAFKSGLTITLAIYMSLLIFPHESVSLAAFASVASTAASVRSSYDKITERMIANTIGGLIAVFMTYTIGTSPVAIGIAAIVAIAVLNILDHEDVLILSVITLVIVMTDSNPNIPWVATMRVLQTFIGVLTSFLVNWLVYPPKYDEKFYRASYNTTNQLFVYIRASLRRNLDFALFHQDVVGLEKEVRQIEGMFDLMHNEIILLKKDRYPRARQLVVYRQMNRSLQAVFTLLRTLHQHDHVYKSMDMKLQDIIRYRLETLLTAHEQILLKFKGRVPYDEVTFFETSHTYREDYIQAFHEQMTVDLEREGPYLQEVNGAVHLMSTIYRYEEELLRLNALVKVYKHDLICQRETEKQSKTTEK